MVLSRFCLVFGDVTLMRHRVSLCVFGYGRRDVPAFYSIHLWIVSAYSAINRDAAFN